jgi:hypothetical protein
MNGTNFYVKKIGYGSGAGSGWIILNLSDQSEKFLIRATTLSKAAMGRDRQDLIVLKFKLFTMLVLSSNQASVSSILVA